MRRSGSGMKGGDLLARFLIYLLSGQVVECDLESVTQNGLGQIVTWLNEPIGRKLMLLQQNQVAAAVMIEEPEGETSG